MLLMLFILADTAHGQSGIYAGGHFRRERTHTVNDLKASGFTYVILFNINVEANGDLTTDGELMCSNGNYVFGNTSPNYASDVASLKQGLTSINRVESCIGGWGNTSYSNIKNLVNSQGTGTGSILYRNFRALKNAIPSMDAINNDDEGTYDVNSATSFHVMLADIGFKTTFAPYMNINYWRSLATNVNNQRGGAVDKIYLQLYEGGAGNNPCDWNINGIELHTGDLYYENSTTVVNKMVSAKNNCRSKGGFIWVYNDNNINLKEQAQRINDIFGVKAKNMQEVANFYKDCNYYGFANGLAVGNYNLSQLNAAGILDNDLSSLQVAEGFKVVLFDGDNFTGSSITITDDNSCLVGNGWNDKVTSLQVKTNGATNLAGTYFLQNRNSGLYMDVYGGTTNFADGANIQQWNTAGTTNQQFQFSHLGDGTYKVLAVHSSKSVDVSAISKADGANVQQWTYYGTPNQQFVMVSTGDGYFKMIPKHSGKLVEVAGFSKAAEANVQQWTNNNQSSGMWKLIPVQAVVGNGNGLTASYFNGMNFETPRYSRKDATINFDWANGSPNASVNVDQFSARWTGQVQPKYSGTHTFYVTSDDGSRLWINNQLIVDKWRDDGGTVVSGTIDLTAGQKYDIKLEYFENGGGAKAILEWSNTFITKEVVPTSQLYSNPTPTVAITSPINNASFTAPASVTINANASDNSSVANVEFYSGTNLLGSDNSSPYSFAWNNVAVGSYILTAIVTDNLGAFTISAPVTITVKQDQNAGTGDGLTGNYFNGMNFETPKFSRKDATISFDWAGGSPDATVNADQFSARWTGQIQPKYSETYTFYINSDNGRRLWINNQLIIDKWIDDWNIEYSGTIALTAGQKYDIKIEYFENNGGASCKFEWSSASQVKQVVPQSQLYSNTLPSVAITSPASNSSVIAPANLSLASTATDADGSVSKVEYYNGSTLIASTTSPFTYAWNNVAIGAYSITAVATDNKGGVAVSVPVSVTVKSAVNQAPIVSITSPATNSSYNAPASITFTANAKDFDGTISKVQFFNGNTSIGSATQSPYTFTWNNVAAGSYTITAKATDNSNATTTSSSITVVVKSVVTDLCSGLPQYVENGGYVDGSKVKNGGSSYQCKPYPYTGWCNGAAWAYAPGTGAYWTDAWTLVGPCTASAPAVASMVAFSPNPATDLITINTTETSKVTITSLQGNVVLTQTVPAQGTINVSTLPGGMYNIRIETSTNVINSTLSKN
jgi:hypothetical protein